MLEFIKNIFRKKELRKTRSSKATGIVPLSGIKSVTAVIDMEDSGAEECAEKVRSTFGKLGIKCSIVFLDFRKKSGKESVPENVITRKDLNWFGRPSPEKAAAASDADLFLSLVNNSGFPIQFLTEKCRAKFKAGRKQMKDRCLDLVIEDPAGTSCSSMDALEEMTRYLGLIEK